MVDLGHVTEMVATALGGSVPVIIYLMTNKRQAKADTERRHHENQVKLDELTSERRYLKPHDHIEEDGPLTAEGIIRKRNGA